MLKKIFYSLIIMILSLSALHAKELEKKDRITREFTVTSLALDAQEARLQTQEDNENDEDDNNTNMQGGFTEEN
jgi:Tfp pilus assembly protein PilX